MRQWYRLVFPRTHFERRKRAGFLFVLPALLFFGSVYLLPLAQSVMYSFYKILPGGASEFVGVACYEKVLTDSSFWTAVGNTVQLCLFSVPVTVVAALAIALGLNRITSLRWRNLWASMYFLPFATSLVAAALIWQWIYEPVYGFLNYALSYVGIPPQKWLQSLTQVSPAIAAVSVWVRIGFDTMIFLAALQSIPEEYYEAAGIDGANAWQRLALHHAADAERADRDGRASSSSSSTSRSSTRSTPRRRAGRAARARRSSCCCTTPPSSTSGSATPR